MFIMVRPKKERCVELDPLAVYFKPRAIPLSRLNEIELLHEELEAIRLRDLLALKQEEAARRMKVSRPTFTRIYRSARKKIADFLVNAKALKIRLERR